MTIEKAEKLLKQQVGFSKILDTYYCGKFVEFVVDRYGDKCTYRVYSNGTITEK